MKDIDTRVVEILSAEMRKIAKYFVRTAGYDVTVAGVIVKDLGNHKYLTKIKNEEFAIPSSTDIIYSANEAVWITIPQNNMKNKFISGRRRS